MVKGVLISAVVVWLGVAKRREKCEGHLWGRLLKSMALSSLAGLFVFIRRYPAMNGWASFGEFVLGKKALNNW